MGSDVTRLKTLAFAPNLWMNDVTDMLLTVQKQRNSCQLAPEIHGAARRSKPPVWTGPKNARSLRGDGTLSLIVYRFSRAASLRCRQKKTGPARKQPVPITENMHLTAAQQQAVAKQGNVLVVAGAGTGKTGTLVERYLHCLLEEEPPASLDEILVVTFTEAAAAEMRQRIRSRLETEVRRDPSNFRWSEQLDLLDT